MKFPFAHTLAQATRRPSGYVEEILSAAGRTTPPQPNEEIEIPDDVWQKLREKYRTEGDGGPIPFSEWPAWAKGIKKFAKEGEKGVGSTIHRMIGDETSERFASWFELIFGKKCGCAGRQARWDAEFPYLNQLRNPPNSPASPSSEAK